MLMITNEQTRVCVAGRLVVLWLLVRLIRRVVPVLVFIAG
jgi:hypothetical protein